MASNQRRGRRVWCAMIILLLASLALGACGGSRGNDEQRSSASGGSSSQSSDLTAGGSTGSSAVAPANPAAESSSSTSATQPAPTDWDRRIVRTADMTLTVNDVEQALTLVRDTASANGGQILASSTSHQGDREVATATIEVPTDRFEAAMSALRGNPVVERVEQETTSSQDVTDEYVDLQSRLRNSQASEERYLALQRDATKLEDVLALEREITRVRGDIEQIQGRLNFLERRTSYSRIDLHLQPVGAASATGPSPSFDLARAVSDAWDASIRFVGGALNLGVTVVVFLWWLWILAAVAWGGLLIARARRRPPTAPTTPSA